MTCYHPIKAYQYLALRPGETKRLYFKHRNTNRAYRVVKVPCNQCIGCRLQRSIQWAIRIGHEAKLHNRSCFITLTYNNENLPDDYSVSIREYQLFMKKVRKHFGAGVRFFLCGEYGEKHRRPHYHACLFNCDFDDDRRLWKTSHDGTNLYTSKLLDELWGLGFCTVGNVTFHSAAYVARYITKKITGKAAETHYQYVHPLTGELVTQKPEFIRMSLKPGIGADYYQQFKGDFYPDDFVLINGRKVRPPRYYDKLYGLESPADLEALKRRRQAGAKKRASDATPARLKVREKVQLSRFQRLHRNLEKDT